MKLKAILACVLWGSAFAGAKIGFQYAAPIYLSGLRFTLAGLILIPVMIVKKINFVDTLKYWRFMLLFAFVQTFLQYGLFFMGLDRVQGAVSAIIIGAGPLFVAIMAHITLKNDKITVRKIIAILLGITGIVFISLAQGEFISESSSFYTGIGLLVLSNIIGSYTNIMVVKKKSYNIPALALTAFANFTGGIMLLITSFIVEKPEIKIYPFAFYISLLWLALIPAVSFSLWYGLLQKHNIKVSELNMWKFIIPVTGCILSWLIVPNEYPTIISIIGVFIITFALQLQQLPNGIFKKK
jgi:drug/metabolite transporter (DMT)-like permease